MTEPPLHALREHIADFCRRNHVQELALFGSALTSRFNEESDIDLLVTFEPGARVGFLTLARMQRELEELMRRKVDLVPKVGLKPMIRDSVLATARALYTARETSPISASNSNSGNHSAQPAQAVAAML